MHDRSGQRDKQLHFRLVGHTWRHQSADRAKDHGIDFTADAQRRQRVCRFMKCQARRGHGQRQERRPIQIDWHVSQRQHREQEQEDMDPDMDPGPMTQAQTPALDTATTHSTSRLERHASSTENFCPIPRESTARAYLRVDIAASTLYPTSPAKLGQMFLLFR